MLDQYGVGNGDLEVKHSDLSMLIVHSEKSLADILKQFL